MLRRRNLAAPVGGEGGIRTPVRLSPEAVFKTAAIDHSATSPVTDWIIELMDLWMKSSVPSIHLSIHPVIRKTHAFRLARRVGLEPTTNGFGDRYSTN
jgi:hypothetical protein